MHLQRLLQVLKFKKNNLFTKTLLRLNGFLQKEAIKKYQPIAIQILQYNNAYIS